MNSADQDARNAADFKKPEAQLAFELLRYIVTFGWSLYPIGYVLGVANPELTSDMLNLVYNVADVLNKVLFGVAIFYRVLRVLWFY